ncbi:MAG: phage holin family protein [Anaerolineales bacterium]
MNRFLVRLLINAIALFAAVNLVPGIEALSDSWLSYLGLALIFGFLNALLRPLLKFLTCPLILLTLGVFTLVINTFLFWLTGALGAAFGIGFTVDGFWPAFLGGLITSLVSVVLAMFIKEDAKRD